MIGRLTSYNNPNSSRERRIGVAFASPVGYQFNRIGVEEGLAAHLSNVSCHGRYNDLYCDLMGCDMHSLAMEAN